MGTFYEFDENSNTKSEEVYFGENVVVYVSPLIGRRSLIRIFSQKDDVNIQIESIRIVVIGDGKKLLVKDSTLLPGARIMNQNYSYEMESNYEIVDLPKSIHGHFYIKLRINGVEYEKDNVFSMQKNNIGYFEALQSI